MLFLEPFVRAEGTGFVESVSNRSIGVIVMSGLVVDADLLDTIIDGNETVVEFQGVAVEVLRHVGDGIEKWQGASDWLDMQFEFGKFGDESYGHCNRKALDDNVVEGGGQGGGVEGFRFFKVCNTLDVGLQDINSGS